MRDDPEGLEALAADDVTELFGWPVSLLDAIREVSQAAHRGEIDIHDWRRRDTELRAVGPAQFPGDQLKAAHDAAVNVWLDLDDDAEYRMRRLIRSTSAKAPTSHANRSFAAAASRSTFSAWPAGSDRKATSWTCRQLSQR